MKDTRCSLAVSFNLLGPICNFLLESPSPCKPILAERNRNFRAHGDPSTRSPGKQLQFTSGAGPRISFHQDYLLRERGQVHGPKNKGWSRTEKEKNQGNQPT